MMLKNKDLPTEVIAVIKSCGMKQVDIARSMGKTRQYLESILRKKMLDGDEGWIRALDACGYDVEVRIKKRKTE